MAKSDAQRRREADARKRDQGLTMCKVWIRPEHKGKLKQFEREHGNMSALKEILAKIAAANAANGAPIGEDKSNDKILHILSEYGLKDDEDELGRAFGVDGLHAIRDAEIGI